MCFGKKVDHFLLSRKFAQFENCHSKTCTLRKRLGDKNYQHIIVFSQCFIELLQKQILTEKSLQKLVFVEQLTNELNFLCILLRKTH